MWELDIDCGQPERIVLQDGGHSDPHRRGRPQYPFPESENYPLTLSHTIELGSMNLAGVKELSLEKCKISYETMEGMSGLSMPVLMKLNLSSPGLTQMTTN